MDTKYISIALAMAIGGIGPAIALGMMFSKAVEAISRNPESANEVRSTIILGAAFAEAIAIYALVVALIIKFV